MYGIQEIKTMQRRAAEKECRKTGKILGEWPEDRGESSASDPAWAGRARAAIAKVKGGE